MTRSYHDIYLNDVFKLVGTLSIKSSMNAFKINESIKEEFGDDAVDETKPDTWKYYMNLCGKRHPTQDVILIKSLDTRETIEFSDQGLKDHPLTRRMYSYNSRYYNNLVYEFPDQELYIKGVLYPTDINKAIKAEDGVILSFEKELIEPQEESLLFELENWLKIQFTRWNVKAFNFSDEYYVAAHFGIVIMSCIPKIINIRLKYAKTREAHSYHIYHYLASHNRLHEFFTYLNWWQKLYIYRNIRYIQRHLGKEKTANDLIYALFTKRFISAAHFTIDLKDEKTEKFYTEYDFIKTPLNTQINVPPKRFFNLKELENKYKYITHWNNWYINEHQEQTDLLIKNTPCNHLNTKHLEIVSLNYDDHWEYKKLNVFINQWFYMASKNKYTSYIHFTEPNTKQTLWLTAEDAAVYLLYNALKIKGIETERVISFFVNRAYHGNYVSLNDIKTLPGLTHKNNIDLIQDLNTLVINQPPLPTAINGQIFNKIAKDVYDFNISTLFLRSNQQDIYRYKDIKYATHSFFTDEQIHFSSEGKLWGDWREDNFLIDDDYTNQQRLEIMYELIKNATPYDIEDVNNTRFVKKAMTKIAERLSSYTVQYLESSLDDLLTTWSLVSSRFTRGLLKEKVYRFICLIIFPVKNFNYKLRMIGQFDNRGLANIHTKMILKNKFNLNGDISFKLNNLSTINIKFPLTRWRLKSFYDFKDPDLTMSYFVPGYENFYNLTDEQKISLVDVYTNHN